MDMIGDEARITAPHITAPHITGPSSTLELKSFNDISPPLCELRAVPTFPTSGTQRGGLTEIPLLRPPKGTAFSHRAGTENHPKGVIFRTENDGEATYKGTLTHAGIIQQGPLPRDLHSGPGVVSGGLYEISEICRHAGR